tara:strand:- start:456 stop:644 length:189 start_codon:yes stop_codon:yes gene_type:complete
MKLQYPLILLLLSCSTDSGDINAINAYELEDLNTNSSTFGQALNHSAFLGKAILYYFPISDT